MSDEFSKCSCKNCGGNIEFPIHSAGRSIACPHCGQETILHHKRSGKALTVIGLVVLCLSVAVGAAFWRSNSGNGKTTPQATDLQASQETGTKSTPAKTLNQFHISKVRIERIGENNLVYCLGTAKNLAKDQRFGVKIELALQDSEGASIGKTTDYIAVMEPDQEWHFKALVTESTVASADVLGIEETQ